MIRAVYFQVGVLSFGLGALGAFLPLLPTASLMILAAFLRCSQHPALERRIVEHPILEPHVAAWRERRGISRKGKVVALLLFPALLLPAIAGVIGSLWIAS